MRYRASFGIIFCAGVALYSQELPARQAVMDRMTEGLLNMVRQNARQAKAAEERSSWLEAAEDYERITGKVPQTAPALTYSLLTGNAHLDAARCWIRYRESRKDYSPVYADEKTVANLREADEAYRKALGALPKLSGKTAIQVVPANRVQANGVFADIKVNQAYLHVLENDLVAAIQDYQSLMQRYPGSASEFCPALNRVEDARRKQEGSLWTRDNQVALASFLAGKVPDFGFVLAPMVKFGFSYYVSHEAAPPYRTQ